ncbi:MAG: NTP transferase domain-containing protein [Paracoccaceae bacterium]
MTVPILILAGGASTRMGSRNKLLEPVRGQPLLRMQAWRAMKASRDVSVLYRPGQPAIRRALAGLAVKHIVAREAFEGMGGSIRAGTLAHLRAKCFVMMLADLVEIEASDLRDVMQARAQSENNFHIFQAATDDGQPGHPILFDRTIYSELMNLRGDVGARDILKRHADHIKLVPLKGQRARLDLDTPEAWDHWRAQQPRVNVDHVP